MAWNPSQRNLIIIAVIVVMLSVIAMMFSKKDKKRDKKKGVKESFVDEIHRNDDGVFSLFNFSSGDVESNEEIVENFPQETPMNVIYTDTNGNLSNTSDLGLQNLTVNGEAKFGNNVNINGELSSQLSSFPGQFRATAGNYGTILRQDGVHFYILNTNAQDKMGSWNGLRPFYINNESGNVAMAHNVSVGGALSAGSISTGGALSAGSISTGGALSAGSISTGGALSAGSISTGGALSAGSISTGGALSTGSISTGNTSINGQLSIKDNVWRSVNIGGTGGVNGDRVVIGNLPNDSHGKGATVGAHNDGLNEWAALNLAGSSVTVNGRDILAELDALKNKLLKRFPDDSTLTLGETWSLIGGQGQESDLTILAKHPNDPLKNRSNAFMGRNDTAIWKRW